MNVCSITHEIVFAMPQWGLEIQICIKTQHEMNVCSIAHEIAFCELFIKFIFLHEHMHLHKEATKVYAILWCNIGGEHELLELLELLHKGKGL
jgi:uncharacterized membrane protein